MKRFLLSSLNAYLAAVVFVGAAIALRLAVEPWLGPHYLFALSYAAVALAAWTGGYGPAILAGVLAYALDNLLFLHPRHGVWQMLQAEHAFA